MQEALLLLRNLNYSSRPFLSVFFTRLADSRKDRTSVTIVKCSRRIGYEHCRSAWFELGCIKILVEIWVDAYVQLLWDARGSALFHVTACLS